MRTQAPKPDKNVRKSPTSNAGADIFKYADFSSSTLKVTKLTKFCTFYLKSFFVFIVNGSTCANTSFRK